MEWIPPEGNAKTVFWSGTAISAYDWKFQTNIFTFTNAWGNRCICNILNAKI